MSARRRRVVVSPAARIDIEDALTYSERNWGLEQRRAYRRRIQAAFARLAAFPELGTTLPDLGEGWRNVRVGQHLIIYRVTPTEVRVDRLIHVRRVVHPGEDDEAE